MIGHRGNDTLYGGDHTDYLQGNEDNDHLYGGGGGDWIYGAGGDDTALFANLTNLMELAAKAHFEMPGAYVVDGEADAFGIKAEGVAAEESGVGKGGEGRFALYPRMDDV